MSRLQTGGLAINLNTGSVVELIEFVGNKTYQGITYIDVWKVRASEFHVLHDNSMSMEFGVPASELMPLGDKQTQDGLVKEEECELT